MDQIIPIAPGVLAIWERELRAHRQSRGGEMDPARAAEIRACMTSFISNIEPEEIPSAVYYGDSA